MPWPAMGVFAIIIESVIPDTWVWFVFNSLYVMAFWSTLYILYPRAGTGMLHGVSKFECAVGKLSFLPACFHAHRREMLTRLPWQ